MANNPYRELEGQKRGPLTFKEKASAAFSGLLRFEPLLEIASRKLDPQLPQAERLDAASALGKSNCTARIYRHLAEEKDSAVQEALAFAFVEAYHRRMGEFDMAMCNRYSALGALFAVEEKERYSSNARGLARALIISGHINPPFAVSALESVAFGRPQV